MCVELASGDIRWSIPLLTQLGVAVVRRVFRVEISWRGDESVRARTKRQNYVESSPLSLYPVSTVPVSPFIFLEVWFL